MKRSRAATRRLLRPLGPTWDVWDLPEAGAASPAFPTTSAHTHVIVPPAESNSDLLAMPARLVVSAALWVPTVQGNELADAVRLELELSGLPAPKAGASSISLRTIGEENGRSLVAASLFPADLPAAYAGLNYRHFEASPLLLSLPVNAATVWREGDDIVVCVTRGPVVAVWETMHADASDSELSLWLRLFLTQLQAEAVVPQWLDWHDPGGEMRERDIVLPDGALWATSHNDFLRPSWPEKTADWQPPSTVQGIDRSQRAKKIRQLIYASAAAYLTLLLAAFATIGVMKIRAAMMASERDRLAAEVSTFAPVSRSWQLVAATVEPGQYPLEILLQLVTNMPDSGIRLTTLTMNDGEVLVEGEATSVTLASRFFESVESADDLRHIVWEMPPPSLLPNSTARFQMRGSIRTL